MALESVPTPPVHVTLSHLTRLERQQAHFSLLPKQPIRSVLSGQHASQLRGRGLNFLELRAYEAGDDVRRIDWKVTARTRKPYSRIFTEERERTVLLVVDQRRSMFFGSRYNMKSTTAAEIAAMAAWRVLHAKDRVGAILIGDAGMELIRPHRSRDRVLRIFECIVRFNQQLSWKSNVPADPSGLNKALRRVAELVSHDALVIQITDGHGIDDETRKLNATIAAHNDLIFARVFDPLEVQLPLGSGYFVTDGRRQTPIDADAKLQDRFAQQINEQVERVTTYWSARRVPVLPVSAAEPTGPQLRRLLTVGAPSRGGTS